MEFNNATTIATWTGIIVLIIEAIIKYFGIDIPHDTIVMFVTGIITFIIAVISSKNPNTMNCLGNAPIEENDEMDLIFGDDIDQQ